MKTLFDNGVRSRTTIKESSESEYNFLNTSAWPWVAYVRDVLNDWYLTFPDDGQLYGNFKSKDSQNHMSALFELYTYRLFQGMGYSVDYHFPIGNRLLDIKAVKDDFIIWCECVLSSLPNEDSSIIRIEGAIQDTIEKIESLDYWVNIRFECATDKTPSHKRLRTAVNQKLADLRTTSAPQGEIDYIDSGWDVKIVFNKKDPPVECTVGTVISSQYSGFNDGLSMNILRRSLGRKMGSTYSIDGPYIIAINSMNMLLTRDIIIATLFGSSVAENGRAHLSIPHPFFFSNGPQNTSVSAILLVHGLCASNMDCAEIELWHNPWARFPLALDRIECKHVLPSVNDKGLITFFDRADGLSAYELLDLEHGYLGRGDHDG